MKRMPVVDQRGRRREAACFEPHEWRRLPLWAKAYSWACFLAAMMRGVRPVTK